MLNAIFVKLLDPVEKVGILTAKISRAQCWGVGRGEGRVGISRCSLEIGSKIFRGQAENCGKGPCWVRVRGSCLPALLPVPKYIVKRRLQTSICFFPGVLSFDFLCFICFLSFSLALCQILWNSTGFLRMLRKFPKS